MAREIINIPKINGIDYSRLYNLSDPIGSRPLRLDTLQDWIDVPKARSLFKGEWQPTEPILFKSYRGGQATDFLWSSFPPLVCVSQRVVELLLENQFTGWATYPAKVYDREGTYLPGYLGFAVKSTVGGRDISRSQIVIHPPTTPGSKPRRAHRGLYFDETKWDGSDIFRVGVWAIITHRMYDLFKKNKVNNVRYELLSEFETDVFVYEMVQTHE